MKRLSILAMVVLVVVRLVLSVAVVASARAQQVADQPSCVVTMTQDFNHVTFEVVWSGGSDEGNYPFLFGDSSLPDVLTGASGSKVLPHDYAWNVGGIITYTAGVTIVGDGGQCSCEQQIVIDDRPAPLSYVVYLPLVSKSVPAPTVDISRQLSKAFNHVVIQVTWLGANEAWHRLEWGDNSYIDLYGSDGNRVVDHWYAEGAWEIRFAVTGPGGTMVRSLPVTINP